MAIVRLLTLMVSDDEVEDAPVESVTLTVNVNVPCADGVPEIVTEFVALAARDNPPGSAPDAIDHAKGAIPPDAATVALYAPLVLAEGRDIVVIDGLG